MGEPDHVDSGLLVIELDFDTLVEFRGHSFILKALIGDGLPEESAGIPIWMKNLLKSGGLSLDPFMEYQIKCPKVETFSPP